MLYTEHNYAVRLPHTGMKAYEEALTSITSHPDVWIKPQDAPQIAQYYIEHIF